MSTLFLILLFQHSQEGEKPSFFEKCLNLEE